jgi:hypothetical protein
VLLTRARARNLAGLLDGLLSVPGSSIFYHTHHQFLAHHFEKPLFHNDFALWVAEALQEEELAEQLASLDLLAFSSVRELREATARVVRERIAALDGSMTDCGPGDEFYFCRSKSFIIDTGCTAHTPDELFALLPEVSNASLYFHFFEARLRLGKGTNDFSRWMRTNGQTAIAEEIDRLNPYVRTLDELKNDIIAIGQERKGRA